MNKTSKQDLEFSDIQVDFPSAKHAKINVDHKQQISRFQIEDILKDLRESILHSQHHTASSTFIFHQNDDIQSITMFVQKYLEDKGYQVQIAMVSEFQMFISVVF